MYDVGDFSEMARDPKHRRTFENLLYLACRRGDADLVAERLGWGIDPNCIFARGRTPMIGNIVGNSPSAAAIEALLRHGADPGMADTTGLTALDHARRKLSRLQSRPKRRPRKSASLDENNQLRLSPGEQERMDKLRAEFGGDAREYVRLYWQERLRAARRTLNDPNEVEKIVELLEAAEAPETI